MRPSGVPAARIPRALYSRSRNARDVIAGGCASAGESSARNAMGRALIVCSASVAREHVAM